MIDSGGSIECLAIWSCAEDYTKISYLQRTQGDDLQYRRSVLNEWKKIIS